MIESHLEDFRLAFRKALDAFLKAKGLTQAEAARRIGISKQRLNAYLREEKPARPEVEVLYFLCVSWGFTFEYRGYIISGATLEGVPVPAPQDVAQQMPLDFDRQFKLTNEAGEISVTVKRPAGRIEVSLSLDAAVS